MEQPDPLLGLDETIIASLKEMLKEPDVDAIILWFQVR